MRTWRSSRQYAGIQANELKKSIQIKDASRAKRERLENKVELSKEVFQRQFKDGEVVTFHLENHPIVREDNQEHFIGNFFGMKAKIFYKEQQTPIIITLGTIDEKAGIRKYLKSLKENWEDPRGYYSFYVERYQTE